jgi:hypothetical protein
MQSTWGESWKSSEFITTKIAFTSRSYDRVIPLFDSHELKPPRILTDRGSESVR